MRPKYSTTEGIRAAHAFGLVEEGFHTEAEANAAFDRWLAQVQADAWDEGFRLGDGVGTWSGSECDRMNPYREADDDH